MKKKYGFGKKSVKRIAGGLMALAMVLTSVNMPQFTTKVYADNALGTIAEPSKTAFLTKEDFNAETFNSTYNLNGGTAVKVNFGKNGDDSSKTQTWYIAGKNADGTLVLMCDPALPFKLNQVYTNSGRIEYDYNNHKYCVWGKLANNYEVSDIRGYLTGEALKNFTDTEESFMKESSIYNVEYSDFSKYLLKDKLYLASPYNGDSSWQLGFISIGNTNVDAPCKGLIINLNNKVYASQTLNNFWLRIRYDMDGVSNDDAQQESSCVFLEKKSWDCKNMYEDAAVEPAFHLDLTPALFASTATVASSNATISDAMTFRMDGTKKIDGSVSTTEIEIVVDNPTENELLYVQWNDGTEKVKAFQPTSEKSSFTSEDGIPTDLTNCKVWLEKTIDNVTYAKLAEQNSHIHSFSFSADGNTITATCTGDGICELANNSLSITLNAEDEFYDGMFYDASITGDIETFKAITGATIGEIEYFEDGSSEALTQIIDAGDYKAKVGVVKYNPYTKVTMEKAFSIKKRSVTVVAGSASKEYDGTELTESSYTIKADTETPGYGFAGEEGIANIVMTAESRITEVGTVENVIDEDKTTTKAGTDPSNYNFTFVKGTLEVKAVSEEEEKQEEIEVPEKQEEQEEPEVPGKQEEQEVPEKQEEVEVPEKQEEQEVPEKQEEIEVPEKQEEQEAPEKPEELPKENEEVQVVETSTESPEALIADISSAGNEEKIVADFTLNPDISKDVFSAIVGTDKEVTFKSQGVSWQFSGSDIKTENLKAINLEVTMTTAEEGTGEVVSSVKEQIGETPAIILHFADNGTLPGKATISVEVNDDLKKQFETTELALYWFDEEKNELVPVESKVTLDENNNLIFEISHCSYYVIKEKTIKPNNNPAAPADQRISVDDLLNAAIKENAEIVEWDEGDTLSISTMRFLQANPQLTLKFSYTYEGKDYVVYISGEDVVVDENIPWYGPLYLAGKYPSTMPEENLVYVVKRGDTLNKIAKNYKTTIEAILKKNPGIKDKNKIFVGQEIMY